MAQPAIKVMKGKIMIEDVINRLAAAIEAQNIVQAENQRLFALLVDRGPATPAAVEIVSESPAEKPKPSRKSNVINPVIEPVTDTRPVSRDDLKDLAMGLSRQDTEMAPKIRAVLIKHGAKTITDTAEDKIGIVFAELNALAHKI